MGDLILKSCPGSTADDCAGSTAVESFVGGRVDRVGDGGTVILEYLVDLCLSAEPG